MPTARASVAHTSAQSASRSPPLERGHFRSARVRIAGITHSGYKFAAVAALILAVEAVAVIAFSPGHILGPDGVVYARYARNLIDHGVFSPNAAPPYEPSIYRTPGYPFFLAGLRLIGGDSLVIVRAAQFALVGVLALLVYRIAFRLADRRAARVATLLCLTYLPFLWIARMHLSETLTSVLLAGAVLLLLQVRTDGHLWRYAAVGAVVALAALIRPVYALAIVPIAIGVMLWPGRRLPRRQAAVGGLALVTAFALALVPWTVRNLSLTHEVRPFGVAGGGTSLLASALQYDGTLGYEFDPAELHRLDVAEAPVVRRAYRQAAQERSSVPLSVRREIAADRNDRDEARAIIERVPLVDILRRIPKRLAYLWAVSDYPPVSNHTFWHNLARLEHFGLLVFTLIGFVVGVSRLGFKVVWPVALFPAYLMLAHLFVHSEGRYSIPARPALIVFAALGVVYAWDRIGFPRWSAKPTGESHK